VLLLLLRDYRQADEERENRLHDQLGREAEDEHLG